MGVPATTFAQTAADLLRQGNIPYKLGGKDLKGMDSAGFISYCLGACGEKARYRSSSEIYQGAGPVHDLDMKRIVPGMIVLSVDSSGKAVYSAICYAPGQAAYPSEKLKALTGFEINAKRFNKMLFCKHVDY